MPSSEEFPGYRPAPLPVTKRAMRLVDHNPRITDVPRAFKRISTEGDYMALWDNGLIPKLRYKRVTIGKAGRARNHMQGIQRLRRGRYLVLSGGDFTEPASHLFVVKLASRSAKGAWGSNVLFSHYPAEDDKIVKTIALDRTLWHAGGISACGDILAVAIENDERSKIVFLHMNEPEKPTKLPCEIDRPAHKASCVALEKLDNGHFVCAVFWEAKRRYIGKIDFYASRTTDIRDGFHDRVDTWRYGYLGLKEKRDPSYQTINFVVEKNPQGTESLYLIGTENSSKMAPIKGGKDIADLFKVKLPRRFFSDDRIVGPPTLERVDTRQFRCRDQYGNMDAAGGIYVDPAGVLHLYAGYHWRVDNTFRLTEFRSTFDSEAPPIDRIEEAWIELFEHDKFRGRRLSIQGKSNSSIADYGEILVQGAGFDDKVSSVRYQIPKGYVYRLYKDSGYKGQKSDRDYFDLKGTGKVEEIRNLKSGGFNYGDKVSSSRYV